MRYVVRLTCDMWLWLSGPAYSESPTSYLWLDWGAMCGYGVIYDACVEILWAYKESPTTLRGVMCD